MRIMLAIPGGPIQITVSSVRRDRHATTAWWTVGGKRLQVSERADGEWELTGHGMEARLKRRFDLPSANVRRAFREFLLSKCAVGSTMDPYSTDKNYRGRSIAWGWDDCAWWAWHEPDGVSGHLPKDMAVRWMRDQARAIGIHIVEDAVGAP